MDAPAARRAVVVDAAAARDLQRVAAALQRPIWIYLGHDAERFARLRRDLAGFAEPTEAGAMLTSIADEVRDALINLDDCLDLPQGDAAELRWQASPVAEKNPFITELPYQCCALIAVTRLAREDRDLLVVVEDESLRRRVRAQLSRLGRRVSTVGGGLTTRLPDRPWRVLLRCRQLFRGLYSRLYFIYDSWRLRRLFARDGGGGAPRAAELRNADALLVTWARPGLFPRDAPHDHDDFLGPLPAILRRRGLRCGFIAALLPWVYPARELAETINAAHDPVIAAEAWLGWRDTLAMAWTSLAPPPRVRTPLVLAGVDVTPLLRDALARQWAAATACSAMPWARLPAALAAAGVRPRVILHPFEGQPWEKALRLGVRRHLPDARLVALQHAPFAPLWLSQYLSRRDLRCGALPDALVVAGPHWARHFVACGYPAASVVVGGAVRYPHLFQPQGAPGGTAPAAVRGPRTALIACSIASRDAFELIYKAAAALADEADLHVLVKLHPRMEVPAPALLERVVASLGRPSLPPNFALTQEPIAALLPRAGVLLHNGTSVAVEAAAAGVPAVLVRSDLWFDMDTLGHFPGVTVTAGTLREIRETVLGLLSASSDAAASRDAARQAVRDALAPIDEEALTAAVTGG